MKTLTTLSNAIYDHPETDCYDISVYGAICKHRDKNTGTAFPSIETISRITKLSDKKVRMVIAHLIQLGFITKSKSGRHNVYVDQHNPNIPEPDTDQQDVCFNNNSLNNFNNKTDISSAVRESVDLAGIDVDDDEIIYAADVASSKPDVKHVIQYALGIIKKRVAAGLASIRKPVTVETVGTNNPLSVFSSAKRDSNYYTTGFWGNVAPSSV